MSARRKIVTGDYVSHDDLFGITAQRIKNGSERILYLLGIH